MRPFFVQYRLVQRSQKEGIWVNVRLKDVVKTFGEEGFGRFSYSPVGGLVFTTLNQTTQARVQVFDAFLLSDQ